MKRIWGMIKMTKPSKKRAISSAIGLVIAIYGLATHM
jgi:hypothetical protein